ncbi:MAG: T9SS type A sorting domain-containing protein [Bacteroidetes bacterium]|nr:T9SS type A sorting domain-containing protein [Bacteroidota bacterium]
MKILSPIAIRPLLCFILTFLFSSMCFANTYTFTGSGSWASSGNWQGGIIPPVDVPNTDTIIINGTGACNFDNPYDDSYMMVDGIFIIYTGKTLNLNSGNIRITVGVLIVDGTLNLYTDGMDYDNGTVNIAGTVNVNAEDGLYSYNNSGSVNVYSTGTIHVNGFEIFVRGACNIASGGLIEINSGGTYWGYLGMITNNGTIINGSGCTFLMGYANSLTNNGVFTNNGNFEKEGGTVTGAGMFNGSGTMAFDFINPVGATFSPGNSPGCTSIDGDFVNNGNLDIELANGSACTNYDQVQVLNGHNATIGGTINITFPSGVPATTTFTIVTVTGAGSITDNSPTINWPTGYSGTGSVVGQSYQVSFGLLPVELVRFKAALTETNKVALGWVTASETNNAAFQIERSTDSKNWENIGTVLGNGTSQVQHDYSFTDNSPHYHINYYRLKQEDFNGQYTYSNIVNIVTENTNGNAGFLPNPTSGSIRLYIESTATGSGSLKLYDVTGKIVQEITIQQEGIQQYHELALDLPSGIYFSILAIDGQEWKQRLIVE